MALLNRMIRNVAITGRTDDIQAFVGRRQRARWAEQTGPAAFPWAQEARRSPTTSAPPPPDSADTLRELTELHARGFVTDAEFEVLRADLRV
jgi:hypothetical protein